MNNKVDRDAVIEKILKTSDPTGELLKNIKQNVFQSDTNISQDLQKERDKFMDSLSQTLKTVDIGFSGDITGSLHKYLSSKGSKEELAKLQNLLGSMNGIDQEGLINNNFLSMAYMSYSCSIQKFKDLDLIVSMIPQLQEAIDTMTDSIIASDSFNNLVSFKCNDDIMERTKTLDAKYDFYENLRKSIYDALKYGYSYTAVIPFKDAFKKFKLTNKDYRDAYMSKNKKDDIQFMNMKNKLSKMQESISVDLKEKYGVKEEDIKINDIEHLTEHTKKFIEEIKYGESSACLLESIDVEQLSEVVKKKKSDISRKEKFRLAKEKQENKKKDNTNSVDKNPIMSANPMVNKIADGLMSSKNNKIDLSEDNISGCIIKHLDIKRLIPIKIDDTILGYYYIEDTGVLENTQFNTVDPMMALSSMSTAAMQDRNNEIERANGEFFKELSDILVNTMVHDKEFLKKNTKFKEQVYSIVRYGSLADKTLKITYLSPDQVVEFGNGESMIDRSLFYGKLYLALLITNLMIKITRGYDKRIYLTKAAVAPEIGSSTLQAIKEIKKDQRSVTMLSNVNSILNQAASTNDLFIPMDSQGNKAIDYDVMSGQDISIKDELLEFLEDRMLSGTGVPTPLIQATTETDFSRTLLMLNSKFLRRSLSYQRIYNNPTCELFNYVNSADMGQCIDDDDYEIVIIEFLPPSALGISAMNEQVGNAKDLVDIITRAYTDSGLYGDAIPGEFTKELMRYLCTILPWDKIDDIFKQVQEKTPLIKKTIPQPEDETM